MSVPAISILVTIFNTEAYLPQCLNSVKNQTFTDFEVICIDDGSKDGSLAILNKYAEVDPRFKVYHQENQGVGYTKNRALSLASGKYVFFLDSDDFIDLDTLQVTYKRAESTEAQIVGFPYDLYYEGTKEYVPNPVTVNKDYIPEKGTFSASDIPQTIFQTLTPEVCNKLWLRSFLIENDMHLGGYHYAEDYFLTYWAMAVANHISVCQGKYFYHYRKGREDSLTSVSDDEPLAFITAYAALRQKLITIGIYDQLLQSYLNLTISGIHYEYSKLKTSKGRKMLAEYLRQEGFFLLGVKEYGADFYYNKEDYACYLELLHPPGPLRLFVRRVLVFPRRAVAYYKEHGVKSTLRRIFWLFGSLCG